MKKMSNLCRLQKQANQIKKVSFEGFFYQNSTNDIKICRTRMQTLDTEKLKKFEYLHPF